MYIVAIHRYAELVEYCNATKTPWPLEPTMRDTFKILSLAVNTTETAYDANVVVRGCLIVFVLRPVQPRYNSGSCANMALLNDDIHCISILMTLFCLVGVV